MRLFKRLEKLETLRPNQVTQEIDLEAQGRALALLSDNDLQALEAGPVVNWHVHREPTPEHAPFARAASHYARLYWMQARAGTHDNDPTQVVTFQQ